MGQRHVLDYTKETQRANAAWDMPSNDLVFYQTIFKKELRRKRGKGGGGREVYRARMSTVCICSCLLENHSDVSAEDGTAEKARNNPGGPRTRLAKS